MVSVMEKDRDVLRFLWFDDVFNKEDPNLIVLRFARVFFGVSSGPFLLNASIRHHVESFVASHPQLVKVSLNQIMLTILFSELTLKSVHFRSTNSRRISSELEDLICESLSRSWFPCRRRLMRKKVF